MGWRERLRQLVLAGGSLAMSGCTGCCNGNPDPCCFAPQSQECAAWMACEADGGTHELVPDPGSQCGNGRETLRCVYPGDDLAIPCPSSQRDLGERD